MTARCASRCRTGQRSTRGRRDTVGILNALTRGSPGTRRSALAIHADADSVTAQVPATGSAVTAEAAGDDDPRPIRGHQSQNRVRPGPISTTLADVLVTACHRHRDRLLRPLVPVLDVHVGAADRRLADAYHQVVWSTSGIGTRVIQSPLARSFLIRASWCRLPIARLPAWLLEVGRAQCEIRPSCRPPSRRPHRTVEVGDGCAPAVICVRMHAPCPSARPGTRIRSRRPPPPSGVGESASLSPASPIITGMIGCSPGTRSKPRFAHFGAEMLAVVACTRGRNSVAFAPASNLEHARSIAAIDGASVLENRYGRERCRSTLDDLLAPGRVSRPMRRRAPCPVVPVMMSTRPIDAACSCVPRPPVP